jgi:nucleoside-diphosphate-sugar epimerase
VLITGASGFIGWHVADQLVKVRAEVRLCRTSVTPNQVTFVTISGRPDRNDAFCHGPSFGVEERET